MTPAKRMVSLLRIALYMPDAITHPKNGPEIVVHTVMPDGSKVSWTPLPGDTRAASAGRVASLLAVELVAGLPAAMNNAVREMAAAADRCGFTLIVEVANIQKFSPAVLGFHGFTVLPGCLIRAPKLPNSLAGVSHSASRS